MARKIDFRINVETNGAGKITELTMRLIVFLALLFKNTVAAISVFP